MLTPTQNLAQIDDLKAQIEGHPACANCKVIDTGSHYRIIFPAGMHPGYDGIQVSYRDGKIKALQLLLARAEQAWVESLPR